MILGGRLAEFLQLKLAAAEIEVSRFCEGIEFAAKLVDAASPFFFAGDDATGFKNAEVM